MSSSSSPKFHPSLTITNVKSLVPVELDTETGMYHSWAELFKVLVRVHDVYEHIIPPTSTEEVAAYEKSKAADLSLWKRLDAAVLQWIYSTISNNLLLAILMKDDTAEGAWCRLESMFQDNKASRATHLEEELSDLDFEKFSSIDRYCNHIKSLADRLADVDAPVPNSRLVLKLTGGLPEAYSGTVDFIQNQEPLPTFESCRSRLKLAERTIKNRLAREGGADNHAPAALITTTGGSHGTKAMSSHNSNVGQGNSNSRNSNSHSKNYKGKKQGPKNSTKGKNGPAQQNLPPSGSIWQQQPWASWAQWLSQWPVPPPCPYPTSSSWAPRATAPKLGPRTTGSGSSILGPHPPQAYSAMGPASSYSPTDIEAAMNALSFSQPDGNYYMDTGATSHMTADQDGNYTPEM